MAYCYWILSCWFYTLQIFVQSSFALWQVVPHFLIQCPSLGASVLVKEKETRIVVQGALLHGTSLVFAAGEVYQMVSVTPVLCVYETVEELMMVSEPSPFCKLLSECHWHSMQITHCQMPFCCQTVGE
jgi:hypothetical protein